MDEAEDRRRLADAPVARLATIDPDGTPNLVPIVFVLIEDRIYTSIDAKPKRTQNLQRLANIERDPRCTVLADHYDEGWTGLWWVKVRGRARVVDDAVERDQAIAALRAKYRQYANTDPGHTVIALDAESWSGWSWS